MRGPQHQIIRSGGKLAVSQNRQGTLCLPCHFRVNRVKDIDPNEKSFDRMESVGPSNPQAKVEIDFGVGSSCHGGEFTIQWVE